jgi:hypothetical protein
MSSSRRGESGDLVSNFELGIFKYFELDLSRAEVLASTPELIDGVEATEVQTSSPKNSSADHVLCKYVTPQYRRRSLGSCANKLM